MLNPYVLESKVGKKYGSARLHNLCCKSHLRRHASAHASSLVQFEADCGGTTGNNESGGTCFEAAVILPAIANPNGLHGHVDH